MSLVWASDFRKVSCEFSGGFEFSMSDEQFLEHLRHDERSVKFRSSDPVEIAKRILDKLVRRCGANIFGIA
jgi:hypothetical protein